MKPRLKITIATAILSALATPLLAADGVLIAEKTTTGGTTQTGQVQLERTRVRTETAGASGVKQIVIFDGNAQVLRMIDPARKTYTEMTKADVDRLGDQMAGATAQMQQQMKNMPPDERARMEAMMRGRGMPGAAETKTVYRKTGTDKVGKWTCDKYEGYRGTQKTSEVCTVDPSALGLTAADFDVTRQLAAFFQKIMPQNADRVFSIGRLEDQGFSGVPVRRVSFAGGQQQSVTELTEVTRQTFTDAVFAVPAGFQKRPSPLTGRGR